MEILAKGTGTLFMDPDPDKARAFFRDKEKALVNKVMTAKEAVARFVKDGCYLAVGGFGGIRISTALLHEVVRQERKELGLSGHTATHDFQILAATKSFNRCDVAYIVGLEARGVSRNARKYMESGAVEVTEWSNAALAWRYKAAVLGVPFLPSRSMLGSDTFKCSASMAVRDPYTGKPMALMPALYPDVAFIHVHEADIYGNCRINGNVISDDDVARASKRVIVTTERIIPHEEIRRRPDQTAIPYFCVDAVVEVPYGSFPGNMPLEYFSDEDHIRAWLQAERDPEEFAVFLDRYVLSVKDHFEYIEKCGGLKRMIELKDMEFLIDKSGS